MQVVRIHPMLRQDREFEFKFKNKNKNLEHEHELELELEDRDERQQSAPSTVRCVSTGPVVVRLAEMAT
jgi:hypothetical protein